MYTSEKILVTGGAGFIGSHLVDRLLADGRGGEVVVFDNLSTGSRSNLDLHRADGRLQIVEADVRDARALGRAVSGSAVVFHLASRSSVDEGGSRAEEVFSTNVIGTFNVLQAAARCAVERVVFTSSCGVYGEAIELPVHESHPLMPPDLDAASKAAGEVYCRAFHRSLGLQSIVLRLSDVYGPRDVGRLVPGYVQLARTGQDLQVPDDRRVIDLLSVDLIVEALVRSAWHGGALPPINVASGTGMRLVDLARRVARLTGGRVRLSPAVGSDRVGFIANVDRMRQLLKLEPPLDPLAQLPTLLGATALAAH